MTFYYLSVNFQGQRVNKRHVLCACASYSWCVKWTNSCVLPVAYLGFLHSGRVMKMSTLNRSYELLKYHKRLLNILLIGSFIESLVRAENQIFVFKIYSRLSDCAAQSSYDPPPPTPGIPRSISTPTSSS